MPADGTSRLQVVLLVDDDLRTTRRMAEMLREDGFAVEIARDGAAAVARLSRAPVPDAVVTELTTAHVDGGAIGRFARSQRPGLPVLVVTGYPNLFDAGAFGGGPPPQLFTKPVEYASLKEALVGALRSSLSSRPPEVAVVHDPAVRPDVDSEHADVRRDPVPGAQTVRSLRRP
jgi:two-component system response regulator MprA